MCRGEGKCETGLYGTETAIQASVVWHGEEKSRSSCLKCDRLSQDHTTLSDPGSTFQQSFCTG